MLIRQAFLRWLVAAVVVLPIWLAVGWAVFGGGGWGTLGLIITVPSHSSRSASSPSSSGPGPRFAPSAPSRGPTSAVIGAWHASIIGIGFYGQGSAFFGVAAILLAIAAFWVAIWQLVSDGARRMQATMSEFERLAAQQAGSPLPPDAQGEMPVRRPPFDDGDGEIIIVREVRD